MLLRSVLALWLAAAGAVMGAPGAPTMPAPSDSSAHATLPAADTRAAVPPRNLDTPRTFPMFHSRAEWEAHRAAIRQQMLVSFGLYPLPPKTPLKARIFDRVERDGYTIEKVTFQTYPGFYLAGIRACWWRTGIGRRGAWPTRPKAPFLPAPLRLRGRATSPSPMTWSATTTRARSITPSPTTGGTGSGASP